MMGRAFGYGYGFWGCGILSFTFILFIVIVFLIIITKNRRSRLDELNTGSQAISILNERLAKGEITQEEYEKIRKVIGK